MRIAGITVLALFCLGATADAAPVDFAQVSADATWVAHVDVDAAWASTLFQSGYKKYFETNEEAVRQFELLRAMIGMDPKKDIHGLTVYGKKIGRNDGVAIVHATVDEKRLLALVKTTPDYRSSAYRSYTLHAWTDAKGKKDEHAVAGAFYRPTVAVFAASEGELKAALDVLDRKLPSLAGKPSPLAAPVPAGAVALARAVGLADAELPFKSPLVKQCDTLSLATGEHQREWFAEAKLVTKSARTAEQVKSIIDGLQAMADMQTRDDPGASRLLKRLKLSVADKTVQIEFRAPVDEIWAQIQKGLPPPVGEPKRVPSGSGRQKK